MNKVVRQVRSGSLDDCYAETVREVFCRLNRAVPAHADDFSPCPLPVKAISVCGPGRRLIASQTMLRNLLREIIWQLFRSFLHECGMIQRTAACLLRDSPGVIRGKILRILSQICNLSVEPTRRQINIVIWTYGGLTCRNRGALILDILL